MSRMAKSEQRNPYLISSFLQSEAFSNLNDLEARELTCVLDLTSRMFGDLNLIFYETQFLKLTNDDLKNTCQEVFKEYTKGIDYKLSLEDCRKKDDWENLHQRLELYAKEVLELYHGNETDQKRAYKLHSNLNSPINLLLDFIEKYTEFIEEGTKYYRKFELILANYQENKTCSKHLPQQFEQLKNEISTSILKFNKAYHIAELRGSKLKNLLFVIE